jgi:hypothetical protein
VCSTSTFTQISKCEKSTKYIYAQLAKLQQ